MTTEQTNMIAANLLRQLMFLKLVEQNQKFLFKQAIRGDIKQELARMHRANVKGVEMLLAKMPNDRDKILNFLEASDEKMAAIGNIIERIFVCTEEEVLGLEQDFGEHIKVLYDGGE